jgi:Tfp pilus assembly protein PilE
MKKVEYSKKGYTFVELVVVTTILMILGSISLVTYSSYISNTRNTKRSVDLQYLQSVVETKKADSAQNITAFVDDSNSVHVFTWSTNEVSWWKIWIAWNLIGTGSSYKAGKVNFAILDISEASTRDPFNVPYSFAATSLKDWQFQLAATLEWNISKALLLWNYVPRTISGVLVKVSTRDNTKVKILNPKDYSKFMIDDIIQLSEWTGSILWFSDDTSYIYINTGTTTSGAISLYNTHEVSWLIWSYNPKNPTHKGKSVENDSVTRLPY